MKKRLLVVFMALCLIVGLLPVGALAVDTETIPNMKVGETVKLKTNHKVVSGITDKGWTNFDYTRVQLDNYWGSLVEDVVRVR